MAGGYAVLDVETTGLHPGWQHRVVEVAVVRLDRHGRFIDEWATLVNPGRDLGSQHIHGITAAEVRRAPTFDAIAGDYAERLAGRVVVGHNVSFDLRFITAEYRRIGVEVPDDYGSGLCTMRLAGDLLPAAARSLAACCRAAGVRCGNAHSALHDARAAAGLLGWYLHRVGEPPPWARLMTDTARRPWPTLPTGVTQPVRRGHAYRREQHFLARLVDCLPSVPDNPNANGYLAVLDSALIDRHLSESEQDELLAVATDLELTMEQVLRLHKDYLLALAHVAWHDAVLTDAERGDLHRTARLLGLTAADADAALAAAKHDAGTRDDRVTQPTDHPWGASRWRAGTWSCSPARCSCPGTSGGGVRRRRALR